MQRPSAGEPGDGADGYCSRPLEGRELVTLRAAITMLRIVILLIVMLCFVILRIVMLCDTSHCKALHCNTPHWKPSHCQYASLCAAHLLHRCVRAVLLEFFAKNARNISSFQAVCTVRAYIPADSLYAHLTRLSHCRTACVPGGEKWGKGKKRERSRIFVEGKSTEGAKKRKVTSAAGDSDSELGYIS